MSVINECAICLRMPTIIKLLLKLFMSLFCKLYRMRYYQPASECSGGGLLSTTNSLPKRIIEIPRQSHPRHRVSFSRKNDKN